MNKQQYEALIIQEVQSTVDRLLPHGGGATVTEARLRGALDVLVQRIAGHTRTYELFNIRSSDDLTDEWNVGKRRVQAHITNLHNRLGIGRKVGRDWLLSADEAERYRPGPTGRPKAAL